MKKLNNSQSQLYSSLLKLTDIIDQWYFLVEDYFGTEVANELGEIIDRRDLYYKNLEGKWRADVKQEERAFLKEFYSDEDNKFWAYDRRVEYLSNKEDELDKKLDLIGDIIFKNEVFEDFLLEKANRFNTELNKIRNEIMVKSRLKQESGISEEMIEQAKQYPIPNLLGEPTMNKYICPFHNDKHPSMHHYPETNSLYCFSCGESADVIKLYQHLNNCNFIEAVKSLN